MKKKILGLIYALAFFGICAVPGICTAFGSGEESSAEKRELSPFPEIKNEDGSLNTKWTEQFGDYFADHFAFRNDLVELHSRISADIFRTSPTSDVLIGSGGWLYYGKTADDYMGTDIMTDREIGDAARVLEIMRDYAASNGAQMIFMGIPNKNSIYPEYMPYNYIRSDKESSLQRLEAELTRNGDDIISAETILRDKKSEVPDRLLYHKKDTHWNNYGAYTVYREIMAYLGKQPLEAGEGEIQKTRKGDLEQMLFPESDDLDDNVEYGLDQNYSYIGHFRALDDLLINTVCADKEGSLLMFRDSFGEALLPFMAESFGGATFSRAVPYALDGIEKKAADTVILELVERNLRNLLKSAPSMPSPETEAIDASDDVGGLADCNISEKGAYTKICGEINSDGRIIAEVNGKFYEAFPIYEEGILGENPDRKRGYSLNIPKQEINMVKIYAEQSNGFVSQQVYER